MAGFSRAHSLLGELTAPASDSAQANLWQIEYHLKASINARYGGCVANTKLVPLRQGQLGIGV